MKSIVNGVIILFMLFSVDSCFRCDRLMEKAVEKGIEKYAEREAGGKVDVDIGTRRGVRVPSYFPDELIPPGGKAVTKIASRTEEGKGISIVFTTRRSSERIINYYENLKGWEETYTFETGGGVAIGLQSDNRSAMVVIAKTGNETKVTITYIEKR